MYIEISLWLAYISQIFSKTCPISSFSHNFTSSQDPCQNIYYFCINNISLHFLSYPNLLSQCSSQFLKPLVDKGFQSALHLLDFITGHSHSCCIEVQIINLLQRVHLCFFNLFSFFISMLISLRGW